MDLFSAIDFFYIFISALLFLSGMYLAPYIAEKNIKWILAYPRWMGRLMEKYFHDSWPVIPLFLLILFLNNFSLFTAYLSGFTIILPLFYAFFTGFNISVISYDLMGWKGLWHLLVNPVAWLEFPAAWLSLAFGCKLGFTFFQLNLAAAQNEFLILLPLYFKYIFTLLLLAAILETFLIKFANNQNE